MEVLVGKKVPVVCNLKASKIMEFNCNSMIIPPNDWLAKDYCELLYINIGIHVSI